MLFRSKHPVFKHPHKAIQVKVNAWIDQGVAPLVVSLNEIEGVVTLDSCQEGAFGRAFCFFTYGHRWRDLGDLLQEMSTLLSNPGLPFGYSMLLEWLGSNEIPRAQVLVDPEHADLLADGIRQITPELNRRMSASVGDKRCRAPHSLTAC